MSVSSAVSVFEHFKSVKDPWVERTKDHQVLDIIVIRICAVICGADDWVDIAAWGNEKEKLRP